MKLSAKFILLLILTFTFSTSFSAASKSVNLKIFPSEYTMQIDGKPVVPRKLNQYLKQVTLTHGEHTLLLKCDGYKDKMINVVIDKSVSELEIKLEKSVSVLDQAAVVKTGMHPKSVEFTPDGKYFACALLEGTGVDLFSTATFKHVKRIEFPDAYGKKKNFVEIVFLPGRNEMWVSQMATNSIHVVDMKDYTYKLTIPSRGIWTKIIAVTPDGKTAFASNWESHDISVIDVENYKVIKKIKVAGIPRGMVVTNDSRYLYVCIFSNGQIQKIDIPSLKIVKTMNFPHGAKRHILLDRARNLFYVTDMYRGSVYIINGSDDKVIKEVPVDKKLNTAKLSGDGKYLYVSSRGPNNPETYLKKGPVFGKVFVIDTQTFQIKDWIWGRNQPTGLDLSPDGKYMAFTNFLDDEVEVYRINIRK